MELVVLTAAVLILLVGVGVHVFDRVSAARLGARRRVLVQMKSGRAFTGIQWRRRSGLLELRGVEMLEPGNQPQTVDGSVILDRVEIEYVQVAG
ncbi:MULTISPECIES: hypothetical protein [Pseudonocardia]|uniref:Uncharacterized protein n=2 Tax=Pseudonocardia TaxID=1847 RepID=A0A1Y2N664_PSEAH|nr:MULTISPECIES: hypothetical protein [Pseudonocardia]OSY42960.1 hypothetical protein BG845_01202 [Pseudonocardia autotrophica]TDN77536.1 hypothetical protein C8E95_6784 [Pseudonocardia autotrophica]BBG01564.1 hypothetical protein Pdca_27730 [Pseudonocardia autotrophica]GEC29087.1 hypothetical protein PSA01_61160 [Pseudonocardia saturnea]